MHCSSLRAFVDLLLEQAGQRLDDAVGEQDAEEGADQRRADHAAEHRRRLADRAHRVHHAQHRGDDAERRQRRRPGAAIAATGACASWWWVSISLSISDLDLVRVEVARDHHAQVVGDELDHVVVAADGRRTSGTAASCAAPRRPSRSTSGLPCAPSAGCRRAAPSAPCSAPCVYLRALEAASAAPASVAFSTFGWLLTTKAPSAPPRIAIISIGSACSTTPMLPPWTM